MLLSDFVDWGLKSFTAHHMLGMRGFVSELLKVPCYKVISLKMPFFNITSRSALGYEMGAGTVNCTTAC